MEETLTKEQIEGALYTTKGLLSLTAEKLGVTRRTIYNYIERYPELALVRDDAREKMVDTAELALESAVLEKQGWAVALVLKTLGRHRGYVDRQEIAGAAGGPVEVVVNHVSTDTAQKG